MRSIVYSILSTIKCRVGYYEQYVTDILGIFPVCFTFKCKTLLNAWLDMVICIFEANITVFCVYVYMPLHYPHPCKPNGTTTITMHPNREILFFLFERIVSTWCLVIWSGVPPSPPPPHLKTTESGSVPTYFVIL